MNLVKQKLKHRVFGIGTITAQDDVSVTVEFPTKTCRFIYPDAFINKNLHLEDESIRAEMIKEIEDAKAAKGEEKRIEEINRKAIEDREAAQKVIKHTARSRPVKKPAK